MSYIVRKPVPSQTSSKTPVLASHTFRKARAEDGHRKILPPTAPDVAISKFPKAPPRK
jgi:hypothetical protein